MQALDYYYPRLIVGEKMGRTNRRFKTSTLENSWSVATVFGGNRQIIALHLQPTLVDKIAAIASSELLSTNIAVVLTETLYQQIDKHPEIKHYPGATRVKKQYPIPEDLKAKLQHAALDRKCKLYELVEACIVNVDQNALNKSLLARFRALAAS